MVRDPQSENVHLELASYAIHTLDLQLAFPAPMQQLAHQNQLQNTKPFPVKRPNPSCFTQTNYYFLEAHFRGQPLHLRALWLTAFYALHNFWF